MGTESSRLKIGVVGTGFIGPVHVEALQRLGLDVAGLVGSDFQRTREKASNLGVGRAYESFEALLSDKTIDVIHITSPNHLHHPQVKAALLAGKHVVCEKPLAMNTAESAELVGLAEKLGLLNVVNFNVRFYPLMQQARVMIRAGDLGDLFVIHGSYLQDWLLLPTDWNWRLEPQFSGPMRAVADIGSHWLDLVTFVCDRRVEAVCADFRTFLPVRHKPLQAQETFTGKLVGAVSASQEIPIHTEDYASVLLRFAGGARGVLSVSQVSAGRKNQIRVNIDGSRSALAWDSERPNEMWMGHREKPNGLLLKDPALLSPEARRFASYPGGHNEGFPDTFKQLYSAFYSYLKAGDFSAPRNFPGFSDGHYELVLGESILQSAREQRWVELPK